MRIRKRSQLIVPIRDRRSGRRIVTRRNILVALAVCILAFVGITMHSELRQRSESYGRLFGDQVPVAPVAPTAAASIVTEGPAAAPRAAADSRDSVADVSGIDDRTHADPMLLATSSREQLLGVPSSPAASSPTASSSSQPSASPSGAPALVAGAPASVPTATTTRGGAGRIAIVGGADGVKLVQEANDRPLLGGGIFRQ
jgi:hypothetical protein